MTKIEDKIYFHVQRLNHRNDEWFTGQTFIIGKDFNNFYKSIHEELGSSESCLFKKIEKVLGLKPDNNKNDFKELFFDRLEDINILKCTLREVQDSFKQYIKWIQEEIFETVRLKEFSDLPSRKNCLWICKKEDLPRWVNMFNTSSRKILKVKANGLIHRADGHLIDANALPLKDFEKKAFDYWSGKLLFNDEIEYLFEGSVSVLEEYNSIDCIIN
jgi:hypothetical protein